MEPEARSVEGSDEDEDGPDEGSEDGTEEGSEEPEDVTGNGAPARKHARRYSQNSRPGVSAFLSLRCGTYQYWLS